MDEDTDILDEIAERPSTIRDDTVISVVGFPDDQSEKAKELAEWIWGVLRVMDKIWDLQRLERIVIGASLSDALAEIDIGYKSTTAKSFTSTGEIIAVGKMLNVQRDSGVRAVVAFSAAILLPLLAEEGRAHSIAMYTLAHEMAHVAELHWRDEATPNILLNLDTVDWPPPSIRQTAITIWEEYSACRLAAAFGDEQYMTTLFASLYEDSAIAALPAAKAAIKQYRKHSVLQQLLAEAGPPVCLPLKCLGYLLGHLDGADIRDEVADICPKAQQSIYGPLVHTFRSSLQEIWGTKSSWKWPGMFESLSMAVLGAYRLAGMDYSQIPGGVYVKVPYTHDTMY